MKIAAGFVGLLAAAFLGLIGLFLIMGDARNEQDITVSFWGTPSIDTDFIGVSLVVIALALGGGCGGGLPKSWARYPARRTN